jgi:hypothetical protein
MRAPIAPPGPLPGDLTQQRAQHLVSVDGVGVVTLGRSVLADELAGPALADAHAVLKHQNHAAGGLGSPVWSSPGSPDT